MLRERGAGRERRHARRGWPALTPRAWLAAFGLATVTGCSLLKAPDIGAELPDAGCQPSGAPTTPTVSYVNDIQPLLTRSPGGCFCHEPNTRISGLDVSSLTALRAGGFNSGANIVVDNRPCESILYLKLSPMPPFGDRMPFGGPYFTDDELQRVYDWISAGAPDN